MSPLERLLAEAIPVRPQPATPWGWTQQQQDAHWQALCNTVGTPGAQRPTPTVDAAQNAA
ncbi:hypothetical protein AB0N77_09625 [Streptomyces misionensis]|uniref:hypothetical protein n=1 Tax=Streptomyces misionensis TaxID=67331 RepID=UPI0034436D2D